MSERTTRAESTSDPTTIGLQPLEVSAGHSSCGGGVTPRRSFRTRRIPPSCSSEGSSVTIPSDLGSEDEDGGYSSSTSDLADFIDFSEEFNSGLLVELPCGPDGGRGWTASHHSRAKVRAKAVPVLTAHLGSRLKGKDLGHVPFFKKEEGEGGEEEGGEDISITPSKPKDVRGMQRGEPEPALVHRTSKSQRLFQRSGSFIEDSGKKKQSLGWSADTGIRRSPAPSSRLPHRTQERSPRKGAAEAHLTENRQEGVGEKRQTEERGKEGGLCCRCECSIDRRKDSNGSYPRRENEEVIHGEWGEAESEQGRDVNPAPPPKKMRKEVFKGIHTPKKVFFEGTRKEICAEYSPELFFGKRSFYRPKTEPLKKNKDFKEAEEVEKVEKKRFFAHLFEEEASTRAPSADRGSQKKKKRKRSKIESRHKIQEGGGEELEVPRWVVEGTKHSRLGTSGKSPPIRSPSFFPAPRERGGEGREREERGRGAGRRLLFQDKGERIHGERWREEEMFHSPSAVSSSWY